MAEDTKSTLELPDIQPKKVKKPYKVSEKVRARNRKGNDAFLKNKAENERKLKEYEEMLKTKSVVKNEVEELLNEKIIDKLEQTMSRLSFHQPAPLSIIEEEKKEIQETGYNSDSERRKNSRFNNTPPASPKLYDRFKRF